MVINKICNINRICFLTSILFFGNICGTELTLVNKFDKTIGEALGFMQAKKVLVSSSGKDIYIAGNKRGRVGLYARTVPNQIELISSTDSIPDIFDMVFSPDEKFVYISTYYHNTIECYSRNEVTGKLTYSNRIEINPNQNWFYIPMNLCMSSSGNNLYVISDDAISVFDRNALTGLLTFVQMLSDEKGGITTLSGANTVDISPDGKYAYVTSTGDSCISLFKRDTTTGVLSYAGMIHSDGNNYKVLKRPNNIFIAKNGKYAIVASSGEGAIAWFTRNPITGALSFGGELLDQGPKIYGIYYISEFQVFASGTRIITSAEESSALFTVDTSSGKIVWQESFKISDNSSGSFSGTSVAVSKIDKDIYVTGWNGVLTILNWAQNTISIHTNSSNVYNHSNRTVSDQCFDLLGKKMTPVIKSSSNKKIQIYKNKVSVNR